jgi:hypothetical protein
MAIEYNNLKSECATKDALINTLRANATAFEQNIASLKQELSNLNAFNLQKETNILILNIRLNQGLSEISRL